MFLEHQSTSGTKI